MFCYKCGNQIPEGSKFCGSCGAKVVTSPVAETIEIKETVEDVSMTEELNAETHVTEVPVKDNETQPVLAPLVMTQSPKKKGKKWLIPSIAVAVVVAIIFSIALSTGGTDDNDNYDNDYSYDYDYDNVTSADVPVSDNQNNQSISTETVDGKRTVLIYIVGSDLESKYGAATIDIDEMIGADINSDKVQVLICAGGTRNWQNNVISSSETSYYQVTDDDVIKVKQSYSKNMGLSTTLSDFINWGVSNYPADKFNLFLWNHGGGPMIGYGYDETTKDMLSIPELVTALKTSPFNSGNKLEVLGFDACLMGSAESAWSFKDYADYYVASQEVEPGQGWNYEFLSQLPYCKNGGEIGKIIIDSYFEYYNELFRQYPTQTTEITLSCINLSKIGTVEEKVNKLFSGVNNDVISGEIAVASRCRYRSKAFGKYGTTSSYDLVDLKHMASLLSSTYGEAKELENAISDAVVYTKANVRNANGLSIYHPYDNITQASTINSNYKVLGFAQKYADYITNFMTGMKSGSSSHNSFRNFSKTKGTASVKGQQCDISIKLTDEQMKSFSSAKYYVFWEMPSSTTFSKKTEYLQVFSGQDVSVSSDGKLEATYDGKAVFGKDKATGKYSDCPLSMNQIYDGTLEEKYYFPSMFWYFGDNLEMEVENVNWLMRITDGVPKLLNAYYMESDTKSLFPDKQLINPDNYSVYSFMNNSYFVNKDSNNNTTFELSGSMYGFEYTKENGFELELRPITNKSQYRAVFIIEDIYGNSYFSDFIPLK